MTTELSGIRINRHDEYPYVVELVLDRPEALNALSTAMARSIIDATAELAADKTARAVVLSSSNAKAYCVGADLKERKDFTDDDLRNQRPILRGVFQGLLGLPMPAVAAVAGYAMGGGMELALSCDLIVADETARFGLPEVSRGLLPGGGGTQLLSRRIGWSRAADLILTGRHVDVAEGERLGFVDRRVAAGSATTAALELAATIAANSPVGVRAAKAAMRGGLDTDLAAALDLEDASWHVVAFSADRNEGIAAFNEKRPPVWPG